MAGWGTDGLGVRIGRKAKNGSGWGGGGGDLRRARGTNPLWDRKEATWKRPRARAHAHARTHMSARVRTLAHAHAHARAHTSG